MNAYEELYKFWNQFGIDTYEENCVPSDAVFPYITYQASTSEFDYPIALTASIWTRSSSWTQANALESLVSAVVGKGGFYNGKIWVRKSTPFSISGGDETDDLIKRKTLNVTVEFMCD